MRAKEIQQLVLSLPVESPYFRLALGTQPWPPKLEQRLSVAMFDPALGWHVAQAYASVRLALPDFAWPRAIRRAHNFLVGPEQPDASIELVQELHHPENR